MSATAKPPHPTSLQALAVRAADIEQEWEDGWQERQWQDRMEAICGGYSPSELVAAWATGRDRSGALLTGDGFKSLCEAFLKAFGHIPDDDVGTQQHITARELASAAKDDELSTIPDHDLLDRATTARLLGISVASLDRYVRRCEPLGGIAIEPVRIGERGVRYRVTDVKAVRAGLAAMAADHRAARAAAHQHGLPPAATRNQPHQPAHKPSRRH